MSEAPWKFKFAGVGRHLPERVVTAEEVERLANIPEASSRRFNGVKERRWADPTMPSMAMAAEAAKEAIADAGLEPGDLDLIINASGSPQQAIPDGACYIQRHLGLEDSGITCMSVHTTCLGFLSAINVASAFIATGRYENILIACCDIAASCLNPDEAETFTLFGDMAAAAVLVPTPSGEPCGMHRFQFDTYSTGADLTVIPGLGTYRHPGRADDVPTDHMFHMNGPEVLKMALDLMPAFLADLCPKHEPPVDLVVPHQSSRTALKLAGELLREYTGIGREKIVDILEHHGNCVSASIPGALYHAVRSGALRRGDRFMIIGTGAGLSLGGAIFTY